MIATRRSRSGAANAHRKEDLRGRLTDCSADGFAEAMLVSCHSFIGMARLAEPLMTEGGSLTTLSYYGAEKVVEHYNVMGRVKAALEASVRYFAHDLGQRSIRVNAISAGPIKTRAASGIDHFDELLNEVARKAPQRRAVEACEVGRVALLLASPTTTAITGEVIHVDAGYHIEGMVFHRTPRAGDANARSVELRALGATRCAACHRLGAVGMVHRPSKSDISNA